jgi:hypothetical protein
MESTNYVQSSNADLEATELANKIFQKTKAKQNQKERG